ncbi:hypothetical protein AMTRI_Chr09g16960 [Amborella trichopoda]|uniref:Peroxidase n=1 Tax=Amborella trichopoda TaxID=13333 RepID=W1PK41_AMBTC|nr:peroxidase 5 [Amborella trichopoda]ERN08099.1 hypothetical protein AMTR_s00018p00028320 [Amborella trichopoda]|eukprot:XP_006846424.1 peroxidase 5 [Amborella trichopoda]
MGLSIEMQLLLVLSLSLIPNFEAQLEVGFYSQRCSPAERIVKDAVRSAVSNDVGLAADLIHMYFHDCFVRGCDGSILIDSNSTNTAEKDFFANKISLRSFGVLDSAKSKLEDMCKGVVSCADILAFAARDAAEMVGGIGWDVPAGRRDGRISLASENLANLPAPTFTVPQLTQLFLSKGLTQEEMVTLSGAHTIGRSHCTSFSNRLFNFSSTSSQDPSLDPRYATQLKSKCPKGNTNTNLVVPMDPLSPTVLDNAYYKNILANRGLFTSDHALLSDPSTSSQVSEYAANVFLWRTKFGAAMVRMGQIGVLTGNAGEIRRNCRAVN